jgi:integrase
MTANVSLKDIKLMSNFKFTEARIASLQPLAKGEREHGDTDVPGLHIRVRASGSKSYFVRYRIGGRGVRHSRFTIGAPGAVRLDEARKLAAKVLSDIRSGTDPVTKRKAKVPEADATTLAELVNLHEADHLSRRVVTAVATARMLQRDFVARVGENRDPATIGRTELVACLDRVRDGVPGHAKPRPGLVSTFRSRLYGLFETALTRGIVHANPLAGYRRTRRSRAQRLEEDARHAGRMLSMDEIAALWMACCDPRVSPSFGAYVQMLIISGCRRTELTLARLPWITSATTHRPALLTIPAQVTKNGRSHVLPLPQLAAAVIAGVRRYADTDLVFPGARSRKTGRTAAISGWSKSWPRLMAVAREDGLSGVVRIHDLRKSARSHWSRLGVSERVKKLMLNHADSDALTGIYDRYDYLDEKIAAMDLWSREIEEALEVRQFAVCGRSHPASRPEGHGEDYGQ